MNTFVETLKNTPTHARTNNGAKTLESSLSACVDFFFLAGASRGKEGQLIPAFNAALAEDSEVAVRILLWMRDIRGGAGVREGFRQIIKAFSNNTDFIQYINSVIAKTPELGRFDDLLTFLETRYANQAINTIKTALDNKNGLAAKWMPRQGPVANQLRRAFGLTPKSYRKLLVGLTNVVETQLCAQEFGDINYNHVPSLAASRYMKTFYRHDADRYAAYVAALTKNDGTAKINAGAIYPHTIVQSIMRHADTTQASEAQWNALPNFIGENSTKMLPMCDVSGSMTGLPMDVSIALGLYISERQKGPFQNVVLTFSATPKFHALGGSLSTRLKQLQRADWGMNTNLERAFEEILKVARKGNVLPEDMPEILLILSDMEFDACVHSDDTLYENLRQRYAEADYKLPRVVFWNLNGRPGNVPATASKKDVALVSGFSPAIMSAVLSCDTEEFTPRGVMLKAVMDERYDIVKN